MKKLLTSKTREMGLYLTFLSESLTAVLYNSEATAGPNCADSLRLLVAVRVVVRMRLVLSLG
jgi:hypothetical protein